MATLRKTSEGFNMVITDTISYYADASKRQLGSSMRNN